MSTFFEPADERGRTAHLESPMGHFAKVLLALGFVVAATIAMTETEFLVAQASHLSYPDLVTALTADDGW